MGPFGRLSTRIENFREGMPRKAKSTVPYGAAMLSHAGRVRKGNEDSCAISRELGAFVVCDGMGGAAAGEVASRTAAEVFLKSLKPVRNRAPQAAEMDVRLDRAVRAANKAVWLQSRRSSEMAGMGTTLVALLLGPPPIGAEAPSTDPRLALVHVGDSRCYRFRAGKLDLLTEDHSLVAEQVRLGEMTPDEAVAHPMRNIITRAVGSGGEVEPEIQWLEPEPGDIYLLASDGLTRDLSEELLAQCISRVVARSPTARPSLDTLCQTLIDEANDAGGGDNVTVLLVQLL